MTDDETPEMGMLEAHTRAKIAATAQPVATMTPAPAAPDDDDAEIADLIDGSPDLGGTDLLTLAAETVAEPRRARGRPKGSANKRNMDMVAYLAALGHRDPMVTLSMLQTADTKALAKAIGCDTPKGRLAVAQMQRQAASDMLPYFYAKKPQQLELGDGDAARPVMVIGEMTVNQRVEGSVIGLATLPTVQPKKPNEINGDFVRENESSEGDGE